VRPQSLLAVGTLSLLPRFNDSLSEVRIRVQMVVDAPDLFNIAVNRIIFVLVLGGLVVKIIDVLCDNCDFLASGTQYLGQFVNQLMKSVRFQICCHLVYLLNPTPNSFRVAIVEMFCYKLLGLVLLSLPFEFLAVQPVLSSESRDTTGSGNSSSSDN
jgi:hypothetical protein